MGCTIFAVFTAMDGLGSVIFGSGSRIPLLWIILSSLGTQFGYLNVQPVAVALYARSAPRSVNAMMVGIYFMGIFFGSLISGRLGGLYLDWSPTAFWLLHAALVAIAGAAFWLLRKPLRRNLWGSQHAE
jgi:POT family proton-dependent oligopeptide transporter